MAINNYAPARRPESSYWITFAIFLAFEICYSQSFLLGNYALCVLCWTVAELVMRLVQFFQYLFDRTNLQQNINLLVKHLFDFNYQVFLTVFVATLIIFTWQPKLENITSLEMILLLVSSLFFTKAIKISYSSYMRGYWIENSDGLDYGSGMAYSFFYGYLNLLLPNKGDSNKNIKELMMIYEATEGVEIPIKKLFILIPSSLYCPPNLCEFSGNNTQFTMDACKQLEPIHRSRAGVIERVYKNSVYKILKQGISPVYVVAEGATPLLTLYNSLKSDGIHKEFYKIHKHEIVLQFYDTLNYLLTNNYECKDLCELIYYDNITDPNINIANILFERIQELKSTL